MSILSLVFVLTFLLLLALESSNLPQVIVLVLNHTFMIHAVVLFLIVGINLRATKFSNSYNRCCLAQVDGGKGCYLFCQLW